MSARPVATFALLACGMSGYAAAGTWSDLWSTPEQQGQHLLDANHPAEAARLFSDPKRRAYAELQAGQYAKAADLLAPLADADSQYNRGNALAHTGKLREALAAYDAALTRSPGNKDVMRNRDLVTKALENQQHPQQGNNGSSGKNGQGQSQGQQGQSNGGSQGANGAGDKQQGGKDSGSQSQDGKSGQAASQQGQPGRQGQSASQQGQPSQQGQAAGQQGQPSQQGQAAGQPGQQSQAASQQDQPSQQGQASSQQPGATANQTASANQAQAANPAQNADPAGSAGAHAAQSQNPQQTAAAAGAANKPGQQNPRDTSTLQAAQTGGTGTQQGPNNMAESPLVKGGAAVNSTQTQPPRSEQALALDQWLRGIPEDSGELLRRKFMIEHMLRQQGNEP